MRPPNSIKSGLPALSEAGVRGAKPPSKRKLAKRAAKNMKKLRAKGARYILSDAEIAAKQALMLRRFSEANVEPKLWRELQRCEPGRCRRSGCSAACWYGDRGSANRLILEATNLLEATEKPLQFVTVIDPRQAVEVGQLGRLSLTAMMSNLRRRFSLAGEIFADDEVFRFVEVALEVLPDGRRLWSPHFHLVLATAADGRTIREALRPRRPPPPAGDWGRK